MLLKFGLMWLLCQMISLSFSLSLSLPLSLSLSLFLSLTFSQRHLSFSRSGYGSPNCSSRYTVWFVSNVIKVFLKIIWNGYEKLRIIEIKDSGNNKLTKRIVLSEVTTKTNDKDDKHGQKADSLRFLCLFSLITNHSPILPIRLSAINIPWTFLCIPL